MAFTYKAPWISDVCVAVLIFFCALCVRLPGVSLPSEVVFDEGEYVDHAVDTKTGEVFFAVHPPLSWMLYSFLLTDEEAAAWPSFHSSVGSTYDTFPYVRFRMFNMLLGSALPALLYLLSRAFGFSIILSLAPALFAILDTALIVYSRHILPETILLFFGLLSVLLYMYSRAREGSRFMVLVASSGVCLGLAAAVKSTGVGFAFPVIVFMLFSRAYRRVLVFALFAVFSYLFVFYAYTFNFDSGKVLPPGGYYWIETIGLNALSVPEQGDFVGFGTYVIAYHLNMRQYHTGYTEVFGKTPEPAGGVYDVFAPGKPYLWPIAQNYLRYWPAYDASQMLVFQGNRAVFVLSLFSVMYIALVFVRNVVQRRFFANKALYSALLLGYVFNFIPFFFIDRPMYTYHYFVALTLALLLIPAAIQELSPIISRRFLPLLLAFLFLSTTVFFVIRIPFTYLSAL